jgi:tetratricopeptide (TPR) repeat protein
MNDWSNAEAHAERAHQFYEAGQWDKALVELKRALAVNPNQSEWHFGMGLTLEALGRHADAAKAFERVLDLRGDDQETMINLALNLNRADEPARAIETLERVNEADHDCEKGYCLRIESYARLGDHESAEQMFYLARQIVDECPDCYNFIAHSLLLRGQLDKALWCWHQAVRLEPYYPGVYAALARVHRRRGHHVRSQRLYLKQLRQDPGDIDTLLELGELLMEMGRDADAGEKFRRVLEFDSGVAAARLHLGELALRAGDLDTALLEFEAARRLNHKLPGIYLGMAQVASMRNENDNALTLIRHEMRREGHHPNYLLDMARLLNDMDQPRDVPALLSPIIYQLGDEPPTREQSITALLYRGVARCMLGETDRGIADFRRAIRLEPKHTLAMQNLAIAYLDRGRLARAAYWIRRAGDVIPHDPALRQLKMRIVIKKAARLLSLRSPR